MVAVHLSMDDGSRLLVGDSRGVRWAHVDASGVVTFEDLIALDASNIWAPVVNDRGFGFRFSGSSGSGWAWVEKGNLVEAFLFDADNGVARTRSGLVLTLTTGFKECPRATADTKSS